MKLGAVTLPVDILVAPITAWEDVGERIEADGLPMDGSVVLAYVGSTPDVYFPSRDGRLVAWAGEFAALTDTVPAEVSGTGSVSAKPPNGWAWV